MKKEKLLSILLIFLMVPILLGLASSLFAQAGRGGVRAAATGAAGRRRAGGHSAAACVEGPTAGLQLPRDERERRDAG